VPDDAVRRAHYYERERLGAELLTIEQTYHRDLRRRNNLGPHTRGIVAGLELEVRAGGQLWLHPGLAVDVYGREILVMAPYQIPATTFTVQDGDAGVWIAYDWSADRLAGATANADPGQYEVTNEAYRLTVSADRPHAQITVDGRDAASDPDLPHFDDESYPWQELPSDEEATPAWLQLGVVTLRAGSVVSAKADGRLESGAVAGAVYAPSDKLLLRPRVVPPLGDGDYKTDFAHVVGALSVDFDLNAMGDVFLAGQDGALRFQARGATGVPAFSVGRAAGTSTQLAVDIGKPSQDGSATSFAIVSGDVDLLTVDSGSNVRLGKGTLVLPAGAILQAENDLIEVAMKQVHRWQGGDGRDQMRLDGTGDLTLGGTSITFPSGASIKVGNATVLCFDPANSQIKVAPGWSLLTAMTNLQVTGELDAAKLVVGAQAVPEYVWGQVQLFNAGDTITVQPRRTSSVASAQLYAFLCRLNVAGRGPWTLDLGPMPVAGIQVAGVWDFQLQANLSVGSPISFVYVAIFYPR
jgi:hypothetical protein